jgi:hypothetical protein
MPYAHLNLQQLRAYDENALGLLFDTVAGLLKRELTSAEIIRMYNEGVNIVFTGDGFHRAVNLNYACFYAKASKSLPLKLTVRSYTSLGGSHRDIMLSDNIRRLIVAGIITNDHFSSFSSSWVTHVRPNSPRYNLGAYLNRLLLRNHAAKNPLPRQAAL